MKTIDVSMGCSVGRTTCNECDRVSETLCVCVNQNSQEWFPHRKDEEIRFDYLNVDKDGSFSIAYTVRKKQC